MHNIICQLFLARDAAHELHLRTRSFAAHVALKGLYDGLVELADELAETYQGKYGLLDLSKCELIPAMDRSSPIAFIQYLAKIVEARRAEFDPVDTHLLNTWDNVISLVYKTKYKLEQLS